jgi:hypothetical protein
MAERKSIRLSDRRRQHLANEIAKTACVQEQKEVDNTLRTLGRWVWEEVVLAPMNYDAGVLDSVPDTLLNYSDYITVRGLAGGSGVDYESRAAGLCHRLYPV